MIPPATARATCAFPPTAASPRDSNPAGGRSGARRPGGSHVRPHPDEQIGRHLLPVGLIEQLVARPRIQAQGHLPHPGAAVGRGDLAHAGPVAPHRVGAARDHQDRQTGGGGREGLRPPDLDAAAGQVPVEGGGAGEAAQRVGDVGVDLRALAAEPVEVRAGGGEGPVVVGEGPALQKDGGVAGAAQAHLGAGQADAGATEQARVADGAHDDETGEALAVAGRVAAHQDRAPGVAHEDQRDAGPGGLDVGPHGSQVVQDEVPAVGVIGVTALVGRGDRGAVPTVVVGDDGEAGHRGGGGEALVAPRVLGHAVHHLDDGAGRAVGQPAAQRQGPAVDGGECGELGSHGVPRSSAGGTVPARRRHRRPDALVPHRAGRVPAYWRRAASSSPPSPKPAEKSRETAGKRASGPPRRGRRAPGRVGPRRAPSPANA